ncbi:three-helix bundle dimerization domain-containing protein [Nonomuraea typhae]|uniref:three-helix bundle dimerization domain-containing protein n=1 Tax=Nonomuraea typhae TaxID=2603600 RepID=UPI0012F90A35|nr:hypothetical protein [Nonomuraea typhae]
MPSAHEEQARAHLGDQLTADFVGEYKEDEVLDAVDRAWHHFDKAPIRDFVPLLAGKRARSELHRQVESSRQGVENQK